MNTILSKTVVLNQTIPPRISLFYIIYNLRTIISERDDVMMMMMMRERERERERGGERERETHTHTNKKTEKRSTINTCLLCSLYGIISTFCKVTKVINSQEHTAMYRLLKPRTMDKNIGQNLHKSSTDSQLPVE